MPKTPLYRQDGTQNGEIDLPDTIFAVEDRPGLVHQVVVAQRANLRQATSMTKNRSAVRGGGKKPWRQKGTGRARQGSIRAPHWVGGGRAFGNQQSNFHQDVPKKMRAGALRCVLSERLRNESLRVIESLKLNEIKTKAFAAVLSALQTKGSAVIVHEGLSEKEILSVRNIPGVRLVRVEDLSTLDAFEAKHLILVKDSIATLEKRLSA